MHVVTYNTQFCTGRDGRVDVGRIVRAVADADLIALQEIDVGWDRSGNADQPREIAALLPDHEAVFHAVIDVAKRGRRGVRRQFGNMLLSRHPILAVRRQLLPRVSTLDHQSQQRGVLEALVETPLGVLRVYCTHLDFLSPLARGAQLEAILALDREAREHGPPVAGRPIPHPLWQESEGLPSGVGALLCGDFNLTPAAAEYRVIAGEPDPFSGRPLTPRTGFADAWQRAGDGGEGHTASDPRRGEAYRLDYCFVSAELLPRLERAWVDAEADGSDHQPLHVLLG